MVLAKISPKYYVHFLSMLNLVRKYGRSLSFRDGFASGRHSRLSKRIKLLPAPFFLIGLAISLYALCHLPSLYASDYTINSGATVTINNGSLKVDGNITISGKLDVSTGTISLSGNWTNNNIFTCGNSTVTFTGSTSSTLTGNTTFQCLVSTTTNKQINFTSASETCITGNLNFENITLRSTLQGATWYLTLSGTQDVSDVDVRDSNASRGYTIVAFGNSIDSGNNTNWDFGPPAAITDLTGLCNSDTGYVTLSWSTPGDDGWTGTLLSGSEYRIDYSTYSKQWSKDTYEVSIPTSGVAPYTQASHKITGLTGDTTWYFQIWTADEIPNWSGLSNGATVWVNPILSISISTDTYNFGVLQGDTAAVSTANIIVTNDGNVKEKYSIKCSTSAEWSPANSPDYNKFVLQSAFHPSEPPNDDISWKDDDILTESLQECTTYQFSIDNSENGKDVTPFANTDRHFWLRLHTPLYSNTTDQQTIPVTISADKATP